MSGLFVGDPTTRRTRLLAEQCGTCVFRPGNPVRLRPGRLRELVRQILAADSYLICHDTLPGAATGVEPALCRGFHDRYDTGTLRLIRALFGFVEVPAPGRPR